MLVLNRYCTERIHRKSFFLESVEIKTPIRFSKRKISIKTSFQILILMDNLLINKIIIT